ncbi:NAD-dependent epimerase/dehydratase family protein [Rhodococcus chondri]|uniref:NAD-dependent epimerase/dehydratase family protein n=1 Tax=Rhodococcus chondri TaxID=3065941 RepID=A0ABU7JYI1_9NOCA|nr:NAD-dependent epimerase/dehydratase family protein [Rhodococcus sp. CC-R104]MEE2035075.1 NAD-dependent epimerase/dehydratase family protein [Rhodococcus sp. CC-R104]
MSKLHVVAGAGPVGSTVAEQLAAQGHRVRILTRSGSGPDNDRIEKLRVDVNDARSVADALTGEDGDTAVAIHMCIHGSAYRADVWERELPAAERTVLDAAHNVGAVVVFPESLYSYSTPDRVMTENSPRDAVDGKRGVRHRLLQAREDHRAPTVSVVASDFFGPHVLNAHAGERMVPTVLAGKRTWVLGSPDIPHSFTYVPDLAAAMIAAAANPDTWNRVLHAPTGPALTQREMATAYADAAALPAPKLGTIPAWVLRAGAVVNRDMRELTEMLYQFTAPFVMDSSGTERLLGLSPTPLPEAAAATVAWWRER